MRQADKGELVDPAAEDAYWRGAYKDEPYYVQGTDFERYENAYRVGYQGRMKYDGRSYHEIEDELAADCSREQAGDFTWDEAKHAARAAWERVDRRAQGLTRK